MDGVVLIPLNRDKTHYQGFIYSLGEEYYVELKGTGNFEKASIKCDWKLREKLKDHKIALESKLKECCDVQKFVIALKDLLDEIGHPPPKSTSVEYCTAVLNQIENLGWDKVKDLNKDLTDVILEAIDAGGRKHTITMHPPANFPKGCPAITTNLPLLLRPRSGLTTLSQIYQQFCELLPCYQRFWDDIDELNCRCWVLEPENVSYSAKEYRIALSPTSSVLIVIDPLHPEYPPECQFLGAESAILPVRDRYMNNIKDWNDVLSLYQNLQNILQVEFPKKNPGEGLDVTLQCGICYAYRLQDQIPEQACNESRCGQLFHHECLVEWIRSVPGAKQSFQTLFGECPYCNASITVKLGTRK